MIAAISVGGEQLSRNIGPLSTPLLPVGLLERLHARSSTLPAAIELTGAMMFADVSRYSTWVELSMQRGVAGLEHVPQALDETFGEWIACVRELDGEIIQFAGDSLAAFWPADERSLDESVRAAKQCAELICRRKPDLGTDAQPGVHAGIGAGRLWVAALGGHADHWHLVASGEAMRDAAAAHHRAGRWQVEVSAEARRVLEAGVSSASPPASAAQRAPVDQAWLSQFLRLPQSEPASFEPLSGVKLIDRTKLQRPPSGWSEIRHISALFAGVSGLDESEPGALHRYQTLTATLQSIVASVGGPAGQLVVDDKGLVFACVFGSPGTFHHDDAVRAIRAAEQIQRALAQLGLGCAIGIATGEACFKVIGPADGGRLITVGSAMNRAARLMAAPHADGIVCDAATERACRLQIRFEPGASLQLLGLSTPIQIYRPVAGLTTERGRRPLVGRARELATLHAELNRVCEGRTRVVFVQGEAGVGKSRLVEEFVQQARARTSPIALTVARAERNDRQTPLLTWRRVLLSALGAPEATSATDALELVRERLSDDRLLAQVPLLTAVFPCDVEETAATRHLPADSRADATVRLVIEVLVELMPAPRVIVLEDAHWLDSASWRVLEWGLAQTQALLVVACLRREENSEEYRRFLQRFDGQRAGVGSEARSDALAASFITLEELSMVSLAELVGNTLGDAPPGEDLVRKIAERSRGNPFYAEEMTLALQGEGMVAVRDGSWRAVSDTAELGQFDAVERVITERFDRLERDDQWLLRVGSVIGRSFPRAALARVLEQRVQLDDTELTLCLLRLEGQSILKRSRERGDYYEFRHDQIRDVVYGSIPNATRRELHREVAEWFEAEGGADAALLVQHFQACDQAAKAVAYAELAAQEAMRGGAFREAEQFLNVCLRHEPGLAGDDPTRGLRWRRQRAEACQARGDVRGQQLAIDDALAAVGRSQPRATGAALIFALLRLLWVLFVLALPQRRRSPPVARRTFHIELARCYIQASSVHYFWHRPAHCVWANVAAADHALAAGTCSEEAGALAQLGAVLGLVGLPSLGNRLLARGRRVATQIGDLSMHARALMVEALYRVGVGEWTRVASALDESQRLCLKAGDALSWCDAQVVRYWLHHYLGDWAQAERTADALLARAQDSGNLQQELWALRCKALSALMTDRPKQARDHLRLSLSALNDASDLSEHIACRGCMALALARLGEHDASISMVRETLELQQQIPHPTVHSALDATAGLVEVLLRGREAGLHHGYPRWREWERKALRQLDAHRRMFPTGAPRHGLWRGLDQWLQGKPRRALRTWHDALAIAQRLELKRDITSIQAEIRRHTDLPSQA